MIVGRVFNTIGSASAPLHFASTFARTLLSYEVILRVGKLGRFLGADDLRCVANDISGVALQVTTGELCAQQAIGCADRVHLHLGTMDFMDQAGRSREVGG